LKYKRLIISGIIVTIQQ